MPERSDDFDLDAVLAETIDFLTIRRDGDDKWVGDAPDWFGEYLFGGFVIAQAIVAATRDAPDGRRLHSMHAYFLRPITSTGPISYGVRTLREGRTFTTRRVEATQFGKPALDMTCSFTADVDHDVYVYDLPGASDIAPPETFEPEGGPGPWVAGWVGATRAARRRHRASRRTASGSASRRISPTTRTSTPRCSASRPTGPASADGRSTSTATSREW